MHDVIRAEASGLFAVPIQDHQGLGIGNRKGAQQDRIHEAVDRTIGSDAQREREQSESAENSIAEHCPHTVAEILDELFQQNPAPDGTSVLLHNCGISQFETGSP